MTCLPTSFNGVEVVTKRTRDDPHLWQAEFVLISNAGCPHIYTGFCSIIPFSTHIPNRMLWSPRIRPPIHKCRSIIVTYTCLKLIDMLLSQIFFISMIHAFLKSQVSWVLGEVATMKVSNGSFPLNQITIVQRTIDNHVQAQ